MTADIIHMPENIRAAIEAENLLKIKLTDARLRLEGGVLSLNARELLPPKIETGEEAATAKTGKQRQADFTAARKAAGYKRDGIHQDLLELAETHGGQQEIPAVLAAQARQIDEMGRDLAEARQLRESAEQQAQRATETGRKLHNEAEAARRELAEAQKRSRRLTTCIGHAHTRIRQQDAQLNCRWWQFWR